MAELPRYKRGDVTQSIPGSDYRPVNVNVIGGSTEALNKMASFVAKKAEEQAIKRGTKAVQELDTDVILDRIAEAGGPQNIEETQAYALANKLAVNDLETQAIVDMNLVYEEGKRDKLSFNVVGQKLKDVADGYSAAMQSMDPESALLLQSKLSERASLKGSDYNNFYNDLLLEDQKNKFATDFKIRETEVLQNVALGVDPSLLIAEHTQFLTDSPFVRDSEIPGLINNLQRRIELEKLNRDFDSSSISGKVALLETNPVFNTPEAFRNSQNVLRSKLKAELKVEQDAYLKSLDGAINKSMTTGEPVELVYDPKDLERLFVFEDQKVIEAYQKQYEALLLVTYDNVNISSMNTSQMKELVDRYTDERNNSSPEDFLIASKTLEEVSKAVNEVNALRTTNPAKLAVMNNKAVGDMLDQGVADLVSGRSATSMMAFFESVIIGQEEIGITGKDQRLLPTDTAAKIASQLSKLNLEVAPVVLDQIIGSIGEKSDRFMAELKTAGLPVEMYHASRYANDGSDTSMKILGLLELSQEDIKKQRTDLDFNEAKKIISGLSNDYQVAFTRGDYSGKATQDFNDMLDIAARLTYLDITQNGTDPTTAANNSFKRLFPETVLTTSQMSVIVPNNIDPVQAEIGLASAITLSGLKDLDVAPSDNFVAAVGKGYEVAAETYRTKIMEDGFWVNNNTGDGFFLYQREGVPVLNKDGDPVEIKANDLSGVVTSQIMRDFPQWENMSSQDRENMIAIYGNKKTAPTLNMQYLDQVKNAITGNK